MHPENLERGSLGEGMGLPFLLAVVAQFSIFFYLLALRLDLDGRRENRDTRRAAARLAAERSP